jgi:alcohol dehydrogenase
MKAWVMTGYGDLAAHIAFRDMAKPSIGPGQVLIRTHAAALNPIDLKIVEGAIRRIQTYSFPQAIGFDVAGIVEEAGAQSGFKAADEVYARASRHEIGTLAEFVALDARHVALKPKNCSFEEAASFPLVALTTVQALVDRAQARAGQKILIHAGSGGVGSFAVQFAKAIGLHVTATTSSRNADFVRALGADSVIAYDKDDYRKAGRAFDIVYDTLGDGYTLEALDVVKEGGTVVSVNGPPDRDFARSVGAGFAARVAMWLMARKVYAKAARARARYFRFLTESSGEQLADIATRVERGEIKPVIDSVFDAKQGLEAMLHLSAGRARGKVIVNGWAAFAGQKVV